MNFLLYTVVSFRRNMFFSDYPNTVLCRAIDWFSFWCYVLYWQQRNILHEIHKLKANWIGHILRRNCLLQRVIEGKIQRGIEVTGRRGRRRRKLLDDLKERRRYSHLKEEVVDRTVWRARFGRGFGPVVRQTTKWLNCINPLKTKRRLLYLKTQSVCAVNTFHLGYKNQTVYAVSDTSRCLFSDNYNTHKYSVGRAYSCWMLNWWCIT